MKRIREVSGCDSSVGLLRDWGPSSTNQHQRRTVNMMVKKSHKMKNGKGVIGEGFRFRLQRLGRALPTVFDSPIDPLSSHNSPRLDFPSFPFPLASDSITLLPPLFPLLRPPLTRSALSFFLSFSAFPFKMKNKP